VIFDLHTHHERCGHAEGSLRDYVEAALAQGLTLLGFSDHSPFLAEPEDQHKPWVAMAKSEFPRYLAEAAALREEYRGRIDIRIGVESDFFPESADLYRAYYQKFPLDYIIGSVHVMGDLDIFRPERWDNATEDQLLRDKEHFCALVAQSARSGMFDILGHIDALRATCPELSAVETPAVDAMLRAIAESDVVMEVNTSGSTKPCGGWYPEPKVLERAAFYGVKVTFGSDAHHPGRVGDQHEQVRSRLRELGYREWYVFGNRRREALPL
jgi:histidinol-phosphatase (PHP family)